MQMRAAFVVFDRLTALDLIGLYDPITRLHSMGFRPDFGWDFCSLQRSVTDDRGLPIKATHVGKSLKSFELLLVPGGFGTSDLVGDSAFLDWLRTADPVPLKASVCSGGGLFGGAVWVRVVGGANLPDSFAGVGKELRVGRKEMRGGVGA